MPYTRLVADAVDVAQQLGAELVTVLRKAEHPDIQRAALTIAAALLDVADAQRLRALERAAARDARCRRATPPPDDPVSARVRR
jgi:hypothetical protein